MLPSRRSSVFGLWLIALAVAEGSGCSATDLPSCPKEGPAVRRPAMLQHAFHKDMAGVASDAAGPVRGLVMLQHSSHKGVAGAAADAAEGAGEVLYVMRISSRTMDEKLQPVLDTWASELPQESLLVVGDKASEVPKVYGATECPDNHEQGLSCKTGHALAMAVRMLGSRKWVFVIDDDHYVNTTNLERELAKKDASKLHAYGIPGCGPGLCDDHAGGFCGGGGYAVSYAALNALVDKPEPENLSKEFIKAAEETFSGKKHMYSDVTCTCLMKRRGVSTFHLSGLYGWRLDEGRLPNAGPYEPRDLDPHYLKAIHSGHPSPLVFHYLYPEEMYKIREEFANSSPKASKVSLLETAGSSSYEEQLQKFVAEENTKFLA